MPSYNFNTFSLPVPEDGAILSSLLKFLELDFSENLTSELVTELKLAQTMDPEGFARLSDIADVITRDNPNMTVDLNATEHLTRPRVDFTIRARNGEAFSNTYLELYAYSPYSDDDGKNYFPSIMIRIDPGFNPQNLVDMYIAAYRNNLITTYELATNIMQVHNLYPELPQTASARWK